MRPLTLLIALCLICVTQSAPGADAVELRDGERVVLLGSAFVERMQEHAYLETLLTAGYPDRQISFRNLGWSGDTPQGLARAVFGSPEDGFQRLLHDLRLAEPTLVLIAYGSNEAHQGAAAIDQFSAHMQRLVREIEQLDARIVLLAPRDAEAVLPYLPDPSRYNGNLQLIRDALGELAQQRDYPLIDLNELLPVPANDPTSSPLTSNGIHLTPYGYWKLAAPLAARLGAQLGGWQVMLARGQEQADAQQTRVSEIAWTAEEVRFVALDHHLPAPLPSDEARVAAPDTISQGLLRMAGLSPGQHTLLIDDQQVMTAEADEWAAGVHLARRGGWQQTEELRQAVLASNELFFHRYRPQNETYLFLFRKHEQGNNAVEIPQFDPLIAEQEHRIAELRQPVPHTYRIIKASDEARPSAKITSEKGSM